MSAIRKLSPALIALFVLLVVASMAYGSKATAPTLTPLYVPVPSQNNVLPCSDTSTIITRFSFWPRPGDAHYIARFEAEGGPGRIFLRTNTEANVYLDLPANSPAGWYTLDLPYAYPATVARSVQSDGNLIELMFGGKGASCSHTSLVHVRNLNIFVSP